MAVSTLGFTSREKIERLYATLGLENILDDVQGLGADDVVNQFISDAEQTVTVRLSHLYLDTAMVNNTWIQSRTTWIAAYYLSQRRGNEHYFESKYDQAILELNAVATGELPPLPDIPLRSESLPSMTNIVVDDYFAVQKLRTRPTISVGGTYSNQHISYDGLGFLWGWL